MKLLFLSYPKCTTCQKAKRWLDENGISYEERHIKEQNPSAEELRDWHRQSGLPLKRFFNTSGLLYKEQGLKEKLPLMDEAEQYALLATNGMLVKRPLVVGDGLVLVGFKPAEWERLKGGIVGFISCGALMEPSTPDGPPICKSAFGCITAVQLPSIPGHACPQRWFTASLAQSARRRSGGKRRSNGCPVRKSSH